MDNSLINKWYPVTPIGEFDDIRSALADVGLSGHDAEVIIAGMDRTPHVPTPYRCVVNGKDGPAETMLVIVPLDGGRIALYLGFFGLLADTREEAMMAVAAVLIDDALAGKFEEPPEINAFQWRLPQEVFQ